MTIFRNLRRDPLLVLSATLTLAVCIGANTTVFSIGNSILIRPLPYPASARIDWISERAGPNHEDIGAAPDYYRIREHNHRLRRSRRLRPHQRQLDRHRAARTIGSRPRFRFVLSRHGHAPRHRTLSRARRRRTARAGRHGPELRLLAKPLRRRSPHRRQDHRHRPSPAHHRRRHAARLRLPARHTILDAPATR